MSPGQPSERSCRQILFFFIRLLSAFSGDLPPGMSPGQPSERSCRQLLLFFSSDSFLLFLEICRLECDQDSLRNGPVNSYYFFSSDCFLLFLEICRLKCDQDSLRNGPVDSYYFFFIRLLPALSGDPPPGISGGQLSERSCR